MSAVVGELLTEPQVASWLNTDRPITLDGLRGKVVVIVTFQMLCPGCVMHGLPQAMRIRRSFAGDDVAVLGLHTVFEHHEAMEEVSLRVFVKEYAIAFPIGIDTKGSTNLPRTMADYGLGGTPSLLVVDRGGILRMRHLGEVSDMAVGAWIGGLAFARGTTDPRVADRTTPDSPGLCTTR